MQSYHGITSFEPHFEKATGVLQADDMVQSYASALMEAEGHPEKVLTMHRLGTLS